MSGSEPIIYNKTLTVADTEYSQILLRFTNKITFQARGSEVVRFSFEQGKVATPTAPYFTLKSGAAKSIDDISANLTLFLASPTAGAVVEIEVWNR